MKIAVPKERRPGEARIAASPETVRKLVALGAEVVVEKDAGAKALIPDSRFEEAGARIAAEPEAVFADADIVLKVQRPLTAAEGDIDELGLMKPGAVLVGMLSPLADGGDVAAFAAHNLTAFAMELIPRISRAQSMDVLSSQSSLGGYRAVLEACYVSGRAVPMMMTAAGTVAPARVVVLGAGVAGLQAIATARRLGARVSAFDVRAAAKEQVESLGADFITVDDVAAAGTAENAENADNAEAADGYAKEMDAAYRARQAEIIHATLKSQDMVICTALVPGKPAPELISPEMVADMKPGAVIVDLAAGQGGNCALSRVDETIVAHGITIVGQSNLASRVAMDATAQYARNLLNFISPLIDPETKELKIDWEDEIVRGVLLTRDGDVVHPAFGGGVHPAPGGDAHPAPGEVAPPADPGNADSGRADSGRIEEAS